MKWRHWSILTVLVLLNYIIFSTAFTIMAEKRGPKAQPVRTPQPTFEATEPNPVAWIVLPTSTQRPTRVPVTSSPTPTSAITTTADITITVEATTAPPATAVPTEAPPTAAPPTNTPPAASTTHRIKRGETLLEIAQRYGVSMQAIVEANGIDDPNRIITGQILVIPVAGEVPPTASAPTATRRPASTAQPTATRPAPPPPSPTPATAAFQFTGQVVWDPLVAPNCSGPAISRMSVIQDAAGNPVNGVRIEVDCYGNRWLSHPSGSPGEYESGHYDFSFGQSTPQAWTCTARVFDVNSQAVTSSETVAIVFDTNDCKPYGSGHQVAILNWTKHW